MSNRARAYMIGFVVLAMIIIGCKSEFLAGGKLHFDQQRYQQALENFEKAALEQPNSAEVQMWRARALGKLERDEDAEAALTKAAELDANGEFKEEIDNTRVSFWSIRYNSGLADARAADEQRDKCNGYRAASQNELLTQCEQEMSSKLESAVDRFQRAIIFCPDSVKNYSNLGKVFFQLGRQEEGKQMFLKARGMAGDREELLRFLFLVFRSLGVQGLNEETKEGYQRAVEMFQQAATFDRPQDEMATIYFNMGVAYRGIADNSEGAEKTAALQNAVASYQKVLEINPVDQEALENLALIYQDMEAYAEAIEMGKRLLNTEPWKPRLHLLMARLYNAAHDREKFAAHGMLKSVLESGTPANATMVRDEARKCPGSDMHKALLDRGEPEQLYLYTGSQGDYMIWIYWTEGKIFIYQHCQEVFREDFQPVTPEKARELIGK
jgi:tetratricopeptide (TPR) repeat protein